MTSGLRITLASILLASAVSAASLDSILPSLPFTIVMQSRTTDSLLQVLTAQNDSLLRLSSAAARPERPREFISHETARWILSALVQAFAALMALVGLFAVFKMQLAREQQGRVQREFAGMWEQTRRVLLAYFTGHRSGDLERANLKPLVPGLPADWTTYEEQMKPQLELVAEKPENSWYAEAKKRLEAFGLLRKFWYLLGSDYKLCKVWTVGVTTTNGAVVVLSLLSLMFLDKVPGPWRWLPVVLLTALAIGALVVTVMVIKALLVERIPTLPKREQT